MNIDIYSLSFAFTGIFVFMIIMFFIAVLLKNNSIIDICWSLNFILGVYISFLITVFSHKQVNLIQIILTILISIWGFRLAYHVARRNIGKGEDKRYAERRESWTKNFYLKSFLLIFMMQGLWASIAASPVIFANSLFYGAPWQSWVFGGWQIFYPTVWQVVPIALGGAIWLIGFFFESVGDRQLKKFIRNRDNRGKIIENGLWKYTRHPNYFGEITMSWALFIITFANTEWAHLIVIFFVAPLMYHLLIRYFTGVPEVEKHLITKPGYKEYQERTNVLFPWFPKKKLQE
ncbi:MAG: DUF1295 domain-containing protein [Candidatus Heimdallarchaeota archaeon]|nr:DUF1295 domain-containing protein [Candidatus Heimdallarchaeota archaeon]MBY8994824.1 DUF1295 domain-containing protein [Candidatus Heimdallarchaeota archaeon]